MTSSLPRKRSTPELHWLLTGAEDEVRTRDPQLGRLMLYRLSYFRIRLNTKIVGRAGFEPTKACASRFTVCPSWPLWYLPIIYISKKLRADGGIRTPDQLITNQLLWPTELHRHYFNSPLEQPLRGFLFVWDCKDMRFVFIYQTFLQKNSNFFLNLFYRCCTNNAIIYIINIIATFRNKFINRTLFNKFIGNTQGYDLDIRISPCCKF